MDERKLNNDLTKMFCINLYQQETVSELTSAAAYYGLEDSAIHRYQNDALFHAKVDSLVFHVMLIVGNRDSERIAALRAKLAELAQCRDHWKESYEDVRAKLKQAEEEALEFDQKIENAYQAWKDVYEQLAAKEAELADLTTCYKALGKKASQYEDQRDENARLCLYWEELFNWASDRNYDLVMDIAETNRELDEAVETLKALGQQQMDDFKAHKAEVDRYRKAVEPVKAIRGLKTNYDNGVLALNACDDCIRILGEAGNERD